jgi:molybdate transport system substrate-binding protein
VTLHLTRIGGTLRMLVLCGAVSLVVAGCVASGESGDRTVDGELSGAITVSAAASLTDSFTTIRDDFVADHPDADITINFGSSGALATQIQEGAPADVAAFADTTPMTTLRDADLLADAPRVFARNQLVIVTKPGNPDGITGLADLATVGVISLCVDTAPCGKFADQILGDAGITIPEASISRGTDVRATLTAVTEGDAVAGIVYVTDAAAVAEQVATVDIPEVENVIASYPIAVVAASPSRELADAFQAYVLSDAGQAVLRRAGFLGP